MQRQRHERAVRPESAIGHQQMEVRVPVGQGAVGLDRGHDANREAPLTHGSEDERGDGARGNPREVAKQVAVNIGYSASAFSSPLAGRLAPETVF